MSIQNYEAMKKKHGANVYIATNLGKLHFQKNQFPTAKAIFESVKQSDPFCVTGMDELASIYKMNGEVFELNEYKIQPQIILL